MDFLRAEAISSGYGDEDILHGVTIHVDRGEIVSIIGPNGAGKSTLLKTLCCLLRARQGNIYFEGTPVKGMSPREVTRKGMCYVPQEQNIFPNLSVTENLEMGAYVAPKGWRTRQEQIFERFPVLRARRKMRAGNLSGGERQMLALGMALIVEPSLMLLDEPSAGLSPLLMDSLFEKIAEINRQGLAMVIVEQNAIEALRLSHRAYVLVMGRNRLEGTGQALLEDPEVRRSFLGG